jgi:hypothetical protein
LTSSLINPFFPNFGVIFELDPDNFKDKTPTMKTLRFIPLFLLFLLACDHSKLDTKPAHTGSPGEFMVITSDKSWDGGLQDLFYDYFGYYAPMLPQPEPEFDIAHFTPAQFSMIIERHRNIFIVNIDPNRPAGQGYIKVIKDKWAKSQLVIEIEANNIDEVNTLLQKDADNLVKLINDKENIRLKDRFLVYKSEPMMQYVQQKFDFNLVIPEGFKLSTPAVDSTGFFWLQREQSSVKGGIAYYIIQNLVIYYLPHESDASFSDANLLKWRDRYAKNITSKAENSYMQTVYSFEDMDLYPVGEDVVIDGQYGRLIQGLWNMQGDFMGGPFVSLSTYDENKKMILTIEGQVYAPKFDKREYLRQMEAILFSLHFPKDRN